MSCCTKKSFDNCRTDDQGRTVCCTTETVIHTSPEFSELETSEEHCEIVDDAKGGQQTKSGSCSCATTKK